MCNTSFSLSLIDLLLQKSWSTGYVCITAPCLSGYLADRVYIMTCLSSRHNNISQFFSYSTWINHVAIGLSGKPDVHKWSCTVSVTLCTLAWPAGEAACVPAAPPWWFHRCCGRPGRPPRRCSLLLHLSPPQCHLEACRLWNKCDGTDGKLAATHAPATFCSCYINNDTQVSVEKFLLMHNRQYLIWILLESNICHFTIKTQNWRTICKHVRFTFKLFQSNWNAPCCITCKSNQIIIFQTCFIGKVGILVPSKYVRIANKPPRYPQLVFVPTCQPGSP